MTHLHRPRVQVSSARTVCNPSRPPKGANGGAAAPGHASRVAGGAGDARGAATGRITLMGRTRSKTRPVSLGCNNKRCVICGKIAFATEAQAQRAGERKKNHVTGRGRLRLFVYRGDCGWYHLTKSPPRTYVNKESTE